MAEAERQLTLESGGMLTAAATFCCGGPDSVQRGNKEYEHTDKTEQQSYLERQLLGNYFVQNYLTCSKYKIHLVIALFTHQVLVRLHLVVV